MAALTVLLGTGACGSTSSERAASERAALQTHASFEVASWQQATPATSPPGRYDHAMVYDRARREVILFGGRSPTSVLGDTWRWDGVSWTQRTPAATPSPRASPALVYDDQRREILLFGGNIGGSTAVADTWSWNGTTWTPMTVTAAPPARDSAAFGYDDSRHQFIVFGGLGTGSAVLNDTWTLTDGDAAWVQRVTAVAPITRASMSAAFDAKRAQLVIFGGSANLGFTQESDTWRWDGTSWLVTAPLDPPSARYHGAAAYDSASERVIISGGYFGSDTTRWDGVNWVVATVPGAIPIKEGVAMAYDEARREMVRFGGTTRFNAPIAETWVLTVPGNACSAVAQCRSGYACVDGVCCNRAACGTCETCAGFDPGRCTPVINREDPDTCSAASGKACNAVGACRGALGAVAASPADCASGIVADGVCCDRACGDPCLACRADLKRSGTRSGLCDFAASGVDPHDDCVADAMTTCGRDGTCDGNGGCRKYVQNTPCGTVTCTDDRATSRVCDGNGACSPSAVGVVCGLYVCTEATGCAASCTTQANCAARSHCDAGSHTCLPDEGTRCDGNDVVAPDNTRKPCAPFACEGAACRTACRNLQDCSAGSACDFGGLCVSERSSSSGAIVASNDDGGCNAGARRHDSGAPSNSLAWSALAAFAVRRASRRQRRTPHAPRRTRWSALVSCGVLVLACALACGVRGRDAEPDSALATATRLAASDSALRTRLAPASGDAGFRRDRDGATLVSSGWAATADQQFTDLGARLPDAADGDVDVGVSRFARLHLASRLDGAAPRAPELNAGRVVYRDVLPATSRVFAATRSALEEVLVLASDTAPRAFTYHVTLGESLVRVTERDGGLDVFDERERLALRIPAPYALDAHGTRIAVALSWDDAASTMRLALPPASAAAPALAYPVLIDPAVELGNWIRVDSQARAAAPMAFDSVRNEAVLFGGQVATNPTNDTWRWNGVTWTRASPATIPSVRDTTALAFDAARGEVIMFGGSFRGVSLNDTWRWNGTNWSVATPATTPSARLLHAMAYDATAARVLVFGGGTGASTYFDDLWSWDGTNWSLLAAATRPPARRSSLLAFDPVRHESILVGGYNSIGQHFTDTWRWDGAAWTQLAPATNPPGRSQSSFAFDATGKGILFGGVTNTSGSFTGDTWRWDGLTWAQLTPAAAPPARRAHAAVFDSARNVIVLHGGSSETNSGERGDTWTWSGATWVAAGNVATPSSRTNSAGVWDAARREMLVFGGLATATLSDTWRWDGARWSDAAPAHAPPLREAHGMAYDEGRNQTVLFGGSTMLGGGILYGDTWIWNGTDWTQAAPATSPSSRRDVMMTYDAVHNEVLLFGGNSGGLRVADTWRWSGTTWTQAVVTPSPPAVEGALTFDRARGVVLFVGGGQTWTWNGTAWTRLSPATAVPNYAGHRLAYDEARQLVVQFGGQYGISETWLWNGTTWALDTPSQRPSGRYNVVLVYDRVHKQQIVYSGTVTLYGSSDTWLFDVPGETCTTSADCARTRTCVDGVCCNAAQCGMCASCAGISVGECAPVLNAEDRDTCAIADGKSCSDLGACKAALGAPATSATECASGFLVEGVCCDSKCDGTCLACRAETKASGTLTGRCDVASAGRDAFGACAATDATTCGTDGKCDGAGGCRRHPATTPCGSVTCVDQRSTSKICDGRGQCSASAVGVACGNYACREAIGCAVTCTTNADCASRSHCENGVCLPDLRARCDGDDVLPVSGPRLHCAPFTCRDAQCRASCDSVLDCTAGASCDFSHRCVDGTTRSNDSGGCAVGRGATSPSAPAVLGMATLMWALRRRRRARDA